MGRLNRDTNEIHAKIVYYGAPGAGKTTNAELIHRKLKKAHRGELDVTKVDGKPKASYESLPVQLGQVKGFHTSLHVYTVPGAEPHVEERRKILADVDGVVFVADLRPDQHEATLASLRELKQQLGTYGRSLEDVVLVVQYNHRDEADENALDTLHRKLDVKPAAHFEAIATDGSGVLQCLTTTCKLILGRMRQQADEQIAAEADVVEEAPLMSPEELGLDSPSAGFTLDGAGSIENADGQLQIPIRLTEDDTGRTIELTLRLTLGS